MIDPFSLVHNALYEIVSGSNAVRLAVSNYKKNIIGGNESRLPRLDTVAASDLPELYLASSGSTGQLMFSSGTVDLMQNLELRITTGDRRPNKYLYPITFALICAFTEANWGDILRNLTWQNEKFVVDSEISGMDAAMESDEDRGVPGYSSLFTVDVRLSLGRQLLTQYSKGLET